jgi:C4-dicarboxylate-specific signal transduction histidine kinase
MFKNLDIKDNVNQNGIGFGLTISKMIIEKLGGELIVKNNSKKQKRGLKVEI